MRELILFAGTGWELVLRSHLADVSLRIDHVGPVSARPLDPRSPVPMFALKDDQRTLLRAHALDAAGNPVDFPSPPVWGLEGPPELVTLEVSPDGSACLVTTTGRLGRGAVVVSSPGTLGGSPAPLSERFEFEVTTDAAKLLNIVAETPELRPEFLPVAPPSAPVDPAPPAAAGVAAPGPPPDPVLPASGEVSQAVPSATS